MNYKGISTYIPVYDNIDKAIAFAPSLDTNYLKKLNLNTNPNYVPTMELIEPLRKDNWKISHVAQIRDKKTDKVKSHFIKLFHPEMGSSLKIEKGGGDTIPNIIINNSSDGNKNLFADFGMTRMVCSNGAISRETQHVFSLQHKSDTRALIPFFLNNIQSNILKTYEGFQKLQELSLSSKKLDFITKKAVKLRNDFSNVDPHTLLTVRRQEDEGTSAYILFNRIQENLTKSNLVVDRFGKLITRELSVDADLIINKKLNELFNEALEMSEEEVGELIYM